ncbi:hypothetical protein ABUW04_15820 [Streptacidiphilus sp. N1-10]|uniref:Uncharacterized protein n=1 Tax=Streptacidiphilus jeojiensis TaxID=3229225 RepID=A0ABV6XN86_9ACTN
MASSALFVNAAPHPTGFRRHPALVKLLGHPDIRIKSRAPRLILYLPIKPMLVNATQSTGS